MSDDHEARLFNHRSVWLRGLLAIATGLFFLGIFLPMITITKFMVVSNSFSVVSGIGELLKNGQILLFILIGGFSVALPIMKIWVLFKLTSSQPLETPQTMRYLRLMHDYGRWAMLDVMVVAVLIVTVKLGAVVSIQVHFGLYVFGASVFLIMLITHWVAQQKKAMGQHVDSRIPPTD